MKYDPHKHHRRSIRLKSYDYTQSGAYFLTICVQRGQCLLEHRSVRDMVQTWWDKLPDKYPSIDTDAFVIMPNHIHGIIIIDNPNAIVGAHPRVRPQGQTHGSAPTLGDVVRWFKTMTTNAYIRGVKERDWEPFPQRFWQRNYYERIIRNERALNAIRQYIIDNPANWHTDRLHPDAPPNPFNTAP